jgi:uncharacterized repeat protein (TIGR02543 family)
MGRSKPYKGDRLGRLALGLLLPVTMALGMSAIAPAATAATSTCTPDVSTIAQCFPDPGLAGAVAQAAGHDVYQPLTKHDVAGITGLSGTKLSGTAEISNLQGIENLTNLTQLDISGNQISNIAPLANLTNLTLLDLGNSYMGGNQVSDISPLSKLTNLTYLGLVKNQVGDISPLSNLTNLTQLLLERNQVGDIRPLSNLTNLTSLDLNNNQVSDVSPLAKLTNLTGLGLDGNRVGDISPLAKLTNLDYLDLDNNQVSDVSPLAKLTNLPELHLDGNRVSDAGPLSKLTNLNFLYLEGQSVSLPVASSSSVSVPTARSVDGSFVQPDKLTPSSGSYDAKTGRVTWKGLNGSGSAVLHAGAPVTIGKASSQFDVTITQPYTPPKPPVVKYAVSFNAQGGSAVAAQSVVKGGKAVKPASPTRSGYTFAGWTSDKTGSKPYDFNSAVNANLALYAQWKAAAKPKPVPSVAISFDANGGKFANGSATQKVSAKQGAKYALAKAPSRPGYTFTGWFTAKTGGSKVTGTPVATASRTLYAQWAKDKPKPVATATISFDANGGKFSNGSAMQKVSAKQGAKYALAAAPSRSGYTFTGWFTAKTGGSKVTGTPTATGSRTLYARWVVAKPAPKPALGTPTPVYRLYNQNSGLHHYTTSAQERDALVKLGWNNEGTSFNAAKQGSASGLKPVYREYNPHNGNHNWTLNPSEHKTLVGLGWKDEGVAWYANPAGPVTVYRLYNPHSGEHIYTTSAKEYAAVGKAGWHQEGTAWKGL